MLQRTLLQCLLSLVASAQSWLTWPKSSYDYELVFLLFLGKKLREQRTEEQRGLPLFLC